MLNHIDGPRWKPSLGAKSRSQLLNHSKRCSSMSSM